MKPDFLYVKEPVTIKNTDMDKALIGGPDEKIHPGRFLKLNMIRLLRLKKEHIK